VPAPAQLIASIPLFQGLEPRTIEQLAQSFKERDFDAGETIAEQGKSGIGFFVIEKGEADVMIDGNKVATLGAGEHFGEIALIDDHARTATVTAKTELHTYGLTAWDFRPLVEGNATIAWRLLQELAKLLRESYERN
jgi:CRP-like cAMP-binding protein